MNRTVMRSVNIPVVGPLGGVTWAELRAALRASWADATACANWMLSELYLRDWHRTPELEGLPKMPVIYLYPEAREQWPRLAAQTVAALEHEVKRRWRAMRYAVLWTGRQSLPVQRYPVPLPLPRQMWTLSVREAQYYVLSARIGDRRYALRLRGGRHFVRQHRVLAEIVDGEVRAGAAYLSERAVHSGDHRNGTAADRRVMLRLSVELPVRTPDNLEGTLYVRTGTAALLEAAFSPEGAVTWREHQQQLRRAIRHAARLQQQLADDLKAERRHSRRRRRGIRDRIGRLARRRTRQLDSALHEIAAHVVGYAKRHRVATIIYDDTVRTFAEPFPWYQLRERLDQRCEAAGITLHASGVVASADADPLAEPITLDTP